jgi:hypothetical protein
VQLAEEVERTAAARGRPDVDVAMLFVRSLVDFQAQLVGPRPAKVGTPEHT